MPKDLGSLLLLSPRQMATVLQVRASRAYEMIDNGEVEFIREGRGYKVPRYSIDAWIRKNARTSR